MSSVSKILKESGTWVFLAPVRRLVLTDAIDNEITIDRITFVGPNKLPRIRSRLGFHKRISHFKSRQRGVLKHVFSEGTAFATSRFTGEGRTHLDNFLNQVREELVLLSLTQLGIRKRRNNSFPVLSEEFPIGHRVLLMMNTNKDSWYAPHELVGRFTDLVLDELWRENQQRGFFFDLLKIFQGTTKVSPGWRKDLRNASVLAGQSQCSADVPQAFLWNMIAIELLLTKQGDSYSDSLPERAEAFIGWTSDWKLQNFEQRIRDLYLKRCQLVHHGNRECIEIRDVLSSDVILYNVLTNIVKHPDLFKTKDDIILFSEKVRAERLLNIRPRTRPKTLRFAMPIYDLRDFEEF
jgi:hypothetical protein